ncbi:17021_t:CDS:1, partial [Dentiscutata erythropus]
MSQIILAIAKTEANKIKPKNQRSNYENELFLNFIQKSESLNNNYANL